MGPQSPTPEHRHQANPVYPRLLILQTCLYCVLLPAGAVYLFIHLFSGADNWLYALRSVLGIACLLLAFVENSLRCHATIALEPSGSTEEISPTLRRRFLPPGLDAWLMRVQQHLFITMLASLAALVFAVLNIADTATLVDISTLNLVGVGLLLSLCFATLVIERLLSFKPLRNLHFQRDHIGIARVILSLLVLLTTSLLSTAVFPLLALVLIKLSSVLVLFISLEYLLRSLANMGTPSPLNHTPAFLTRSMLTALYHWPLRPLHLLLEAIKSRFGVDLARIQAFRLIGRRLVPVTCLMVMLGWLLSGLSETPLHQRGIYERFGRPVDVLSPGLHAGLPWPFGRVITIENGAVHELQLGDLTEKTKASRDQSDAEGPAPQSSWRLWDSSHAADQSQVIASTASGSQNFQIVNMDIRLIWRVALTDSDALNSQYQTDQLPELIRGIARQVLVKQFASAQLDDLLTGQQATLAGVLNQKIQRRLSALNTGVELLFTRIEAIHPPAGAADAWHGVQAAQISENAVIAREKGYAAVVNNDAQNKALTLIHDAEARAAENLAQANAESTHFAAEHQAWQQAGNAFLLERRYQILSQTLAHAPLLILDNHLPDTSKPVLDFRQYADLPDSTAAQKAGTK